MNKNLLKVGIIFLLLIFVLINISWAYSFNVTMTPSSDSSGNVIIKLKLSNLDVGENGVNAFSAILNVDSSVYENVSSSDVMGLNNWTSNYSESTSKLTLIKTTPIKSDEEVLQITLKPKSGSTKKSGTVSLKSIIASNGTDEITISDYSVNVSATGSISASTTNTSNTTPTNKTSSNNTTTITISNNSNIAITSNTTNRVNNNANSNNVSNNNANNTTVATNNVSNYNTSTNTQNTVVPTNLANSVSSDETVPYTGTRENVRIILIVLLIVAFGIYIKFEKINKIC